MTPAQMSALHHAAFHDSRGWSAREIAALLASPHTTALTVPHGFAILRTLAGESELLTLAVDPAHQRKGIARALMQRWLAVCTEQADAALLEVAADNVAARALYDSLGFEICGTRPAYYARTMAPAVDAILMRRDVTPDHRGESAPPASESG